MRVPSLGWEDSLEEEMATHSLILAWRIPWTEELGEMQSTGSHRVRYDWSDLAGMHTLGRGGSFMAFLREGCSFFFSWPFSLACWILFPWPGIEPRISAVRAWHPNPCTTLEFPKLLILTKAVCPWQPLLKQLGVGESVSSVFFYFKFHFLHF